LLSYVTPMRKAERAQSGAPADLSELIRGTYPFDGETHRDVYVDVSQRAFYYAEQAASETPATTKFYGPFSVDRDYDIS
jgi:hypothetical protein